MDRNFSLIVVLCGLLFFSGCAKDSSDRKPAQSVRPIAPRDLDITQFDLSDRNTEALSEQETDLSLQVYTDLGRMAYVWEEMKPQNPSSDESSGGSNPQKPNLDQPPVQIGESAPAYEPIAKQNRFFDSEFFVQNLLQSLKSKPLCNTTSKRQGGPNETNFSETVSTSGASCPVHSELNANAKFSNNESEKTMTAESTATISFKINDLSQQDFSLQEIIAGNESMQANMMIKFPKQGEMNFAMSGNVKHQGSYISRSNGRIKVTTEGVVAIETLGPSSQSGTILAAAGTFILEFESGLKSVLLIKMDPTDPNLEKCTLNKRVLTKSECTLLIDKLNVRPSIEASPTGDEKEGGSSEPEPITKK